MHSWQNPTKSKANSFAAHLLVVTPWLNPQNITHIQNQQTMIKRKTIINIIWELLSVHTTLCVPGQQCFVWWYFTLNLRAVCPPCQHHLKELNIIWTWKINNLSLSCKEWEKKHVQWTSCFAKQETSDALRSVWFKRDSYHKEYHFLQDDLRSRVSLTDLTVDQHKHTH